LHQDHRLLNELTWNTFRDHLILEYEIPKYDGDLGSPQLFPIKRIDLPEKAAFFSRLPHAGTETMFSDATFLALMRLRGVEAGFLRGVRLKLLRKKKIGRTQISVVLRNFIFQDEVIAKRVPGQFIEQAIGPGASHDDSA